LTQSEDSDVPPSIATAETKSEQGDQIFSSSKREMSLYEAACTLTLGFEKLMYALLTTRSTSTQNGKFFLRLEYLS
jgi:hypothetical protein